MSELTPEQLQQLDNGQAVEVTDEQGAVRYVVFPGNVYERVKRLLYESSELEDDELRFLLARSAEGNGWAEPGMDAYDRYDEERARRCL